MLTLRASCFTTGATYGVRGAAGLDSTNGWTWCGVAGGFTGFRLPPPLVSIIKRSKAFSPRSCSCCQSWNGSSSSSLWSRLRLLTCSPKP